MILSLVLIVCCDAVENVAIFVVERGYAGAG
jgi:hypothetical protein